MKLGEALRSAGVLSGLSVPGWFTALADLLDAGPGLGATGAGKVSLPAGLVPELGGGFDVQVTGGPSSAKLVVPLGTLRFAWNGGEARGTSGATLTVEVDNRARVTCTVAGSGTLAVSGTPMRIAGPGGTALELPLDSATVLAEPGVAIGGKLRLVGVPGAQVDVPFALRWGIGGLSGSATGTAGSTAFTVNWAGGHDLRPASLVVDVPLKSDTVPGVTIKGRLRVLGSRAATGMGLSAEVIASADGILASGDPKVVTGATLLAACAAAGTAPTGLVGTAAVAAAGATLSTALHSTGTARVTRATVDLAKPTAAVIDYVTELGCSVDVGFVKCGTTSPMRAAVTGLRVDWSDPLKPVLDWRRATLDLADPGQWKVEKPKGLLQIDQVRSGSGTQWFEIDLRFAMDLGPVEVQKATIRVLLDGGTLSASLRGFGVGVTVPGLVKGSGSVAFTDPGGVLHAALVVDLVPLNLALGAALTMGPASDGQGTYQSLQAELGIDLPAPIPLASTGLGLFGLSGLLGINRAATFGTTFEQRLDWDPAIGTTAQRGASTFGLKVAIGTLPDLGHAFGAVGRLAVTTPEIAVLAAVSAKLLAGRPRVTDSTASSSGAPRLRGALAISSREIGLAVQADYHFPTDGFVLFEGVAPVEARWTRADPSGWLVHLGTDRSRPPGPIRMAVLPGLLPNGIARSEAFLMVHGNGITGLPIAVSDRGLVVAAGIDISTTIVAFPVVAEIWARGMVGVSTKPVFLTGRAEVGGALRLGPFRLGVSAGLDFQVGPGSMYAAKLRICGEIDLWLFEISGCVTISIGNQQTPAPDPPESPVASVTLADHRGVAVKPANGTLTCWPDATIQVGFTPAPAVSNPTMGRFKIGGATYPRTGTLSLGPSYTAHYRLTSLDLKPLSGAAGPSGLPATWQTKPAQPTISADGAAVLALLTLDNAQWTAHLADGGSSDISGLGPARRKECNNEKWMARAGWAVGAPARERRPHHWWLPHRPPDQSAGSLDSRLEASTLTRWPAIMPFRRVEATAGNRALLPLGVLAVPGRTVRSQVVTGEDEVFDGWLVLPDAEWNVRPEVPPVCTTTLTVSDTVVQDGVLLLVVHRSDREQVSVRSYVGQDPDFDWTRTDQIDMDDDLVLQTWRTSDPPSSESFSSVQVTHPELIAPDPREEDRFRGVGVVAVGGVTERARDIAVSVNQNKPFTAPSPIPPQKTPAGYVPPLRPEVRHRFTVGWSGVAVGADGQNAAVTGTHPALEFLVAPPVPQRPSVDRLHTATDVFHPAMLARYLRGYRPDGGAPWFADDPVAAVLDRSGLTVPHAYGLTPTLVVTRTDEPGQAPLTMLQVVAESVLLRPGELSMLDAVNSLKCALPHGPVTLAAKAELLPDRAYDLTVSFPRADNTEFDLGRLPPVAFRTSRWRSPQAMFAGAGCTVPGASPDPQAVVRVAAAPSTLASAPREQSDGALLAALAGRAGRLLDTPIRTTILVTPGAATATASTVAGVLLECVEPLRRGHALRDVWMSGGASTGASWPKVSDRVGTAILFVPPAPVALSAVDVRWTAWGKDVTARLVVPSPASTRTLVGLAGGAP